MIDRLFLLFLLSLLQSSGIGQNLPVDKNLQDYINLLKEKKVESYIILEGGCVGCEVKNKNGKVLPDAKFAYILSKKNDKFILQEFNSFQENKVIQLDSTTIFYLIEKNKQALVSKDNYYKQEDKKKITKKGNVIFRPPSPIHYSYDVLTINLPNYKTDFKLINGEKDSMGYIITDKIWFKPTKEIITRIENLIQTIEK